MEAIESTTTTINCKKTNNNLTKPFQDDNYYSQTKLNNEKVEEKGEKEHEDLMDPLSTRTIKPSVTFSKQREYEQLPSNNYSKNNNSNGDDAQFSQIRRWLSLSHFGNQFSELAWQFAIVIWLTEITNYSSLLFVSTYGVTLQVMVACATPLVGQWIDDMARQQRRLEVAIRLIGLENLCVILATLVCFTVTSHLSTNFDGDFLDSNNATNSNNDDQHRGSATGCTSNEDECIHFNWTIFENSKDRWFIWGGIVIIHFLGGFAQVLDRSFLVAVERDWVVLLSQFGEDGNSNDGTDANMSSTLSSLNVMLKQIDLSCQVLAPSITGWILLYFKSNGILWIGGLNCLALIMELAAMTKIHNHIAAFSTVADGQRKGHQHTNKNGNETVTQQQDVGGNMCGDDCDSENEQDGSNPAVSSCTASLQVYFEQRHIAWAGFALALLYFNVLTFSGMMTAYLVSRGMSLTTIGLWRGVSSLVGLVATCIYHQSEKYFSLPFTAMWSIAWECLCLTATFGSIFVHDTTLSLTLLIGGVLPSRIGLWVFDIAVTQLFQQNVAGPVRGQVGGVQMSLNAIMELLPFGLAIIYNRPDQFFVLIAGGYMAVVMATAIYLVGFYAPMKQHPHSRILQTEDSFRNEVELTDL